MDTPQNAANQPATKKSPSETGHAINLRNFDLLIQTVTQFRQKYNPSNPDLALSALQNQYNIAKQQLDNITSSETSYDNATASRAATFKQMKEISSKVNSNFKSSKVPKSAKEHALTIMKKIRGSASKLTKKEILSEGEEGQKKISNSQQSFAQLIEHFKKLRELVSSHQGYAPNEEELMPINLVELETKLNTENVNVNYTITNWRSIRQGRQKQFYKPETGMVDTALAVKDYVASVFGTISIEFKEIRKINFRNIGN